MGDTVQNITAGLLLIGLCLVGWFFYAGDSLNMPGNIETQAAQQTREFRAILSQLNTVSVDSSLFTDENFLQMEDRTNEIDPRPVGRTNPFEPIY